MIGFFIVPTRVVQTVQVGCISRSRGQKIGFKLPFSNIVSGTTRSKAYICSLQHHQEVLHQNYATWGQPWPCLMGNKIILIYIAKSPLKLP